MSGNLPVKREGPVLDELVNTLRVRLPDLRQMYAVRALAIFGSYARGEARDESDLDLLVDFERAPGLITFIELEQHLSDLLGVKVDLVMRDALKPAIAQRILTELIAV